SGVAMLALGGAYHIDCRRRQSHTREFARFSAHTSFAPFAAILSGRARFTVEDIRWLPVGTAAAAYLLLLVLHRAVIGVAPWPS
ncbi:MAG: NnrU family protein, partial [Gammaproteobacteria bacterium]|nr:NnrU family protein [Gammaproteobacteria bacterium]